MGRKRRRGCRRDKKINNTKAKAEPSSPKVMDEEKFVPHIPDDIVVKILSGLPLNSLARLTCISKQWRSMISDMFTKKRGRQMVVFISKLGEASDALRCFDPELLDTSAVRKPWKKMKPRGRVVRICGSCNGLLLMGVDDNLFLWNPLIGCWKKVLSYKRLTDLHYRIVSGLCYDSATNEYKVVMAFAYSGRESVAVVGSFSCKSWTSIPFPYDVSKVDPGPVVNGYLHWCTNVRISGSSNQIIYFNPRMGEFNKFPMPQPKHANGDVVIGLGALDRCLCMSRMNNPVNYDDNTVEILAMKEYGVEKTWTIIHVISNARCDPYGSLVPLSRAQNGKALLVIRMRSHYNYGWRQYWNITAYNTIDDSYKNIPISSGDDHVEAVAYEESFVRPTGYDWEEEDARGEATYVEYFPDKPPRIFKRVRDGRWGLEYEQPDFQTEEWCIDS